MSKILFVLLSYFLYNVICQENIISIPNGLTRFAVNNFVRVTLSGQNANYSTQTKRACIMGRNRMLYMKFNIEHYQAMGAACGNCSGGVTTDCSRSQCVHADGIEKGIMTINRLLPGPLIEVCQGDLIVIDVINMLHSDTTSIHWHGIFQRGTPYADGVPHLTQCPILPMTTFRYIFWADNYGTHFYHSHSGVQKFLGIYGGLIIRAPALVEGFPSNLYDVDDRVIVLNDWSHEASEMFMVGLPTRLPGPEPEAILINGKGKFFNRQTNRFTNSPYEVIYVNPGRRYRIRIISAISMVCPIEFQIQGHRMRVIATDGSPVSPVYVDTLVMTSGERFDIVLSATRPSGLYWIFTRLTGVCAELNITQSAILSYISQSGQQTPSSSPGPYSRGVVLNDPEISCGQVANNLCIIDLSSVNPQFSLARTTIDQRFYMTFGNRDLNPNTHFLSGRMDTFWNTRDRILLLGSMNGISFVSPPTEILSYLARGSDLSFIEMCNYENIPARCTNSSICRCTHVVTVQLGSVVEFVLIDEAPFALPIVHPIHFHGLSFQVMSQGIIESNDTLTVEEVSRMNRLGLLQPLVPNPPLKDTLTVHSHGYAVIRFVADNPGMWLVHCHVDDHMLFGMVFVLYVEGGNIPQPPQGFPQCGHFPPTF